MLQDLSNISHLAELALKLRTVDSQSCVLTVLKWGKQLISKQANSKRHKPLDAGLEEVNTQKPQKTESPAPTLTLTLS